MVWVSLWFPSINRDQQLAGSCHRYGRDGLKPAPFSRGTTTSQTQTGPSSETNSPAVSLPGPKSLLVQCSQQHLPGFYLTPTTSSGLHFPALLPLLPSCWHIPAPSAIPKYNPGRFSSQTPYSMPDTAPAHLLALAARQVRQSWALPGQQLGAQDTGWPQARAGALGSQNSAGSGTWALLLMGTGGQAEPSASSPAPMWHGAVQNPPRRGALPWAQPRLLSHFKDTSPAGCPATPTSTAFRPPPDTNAEETCCERQPLVPFSQSFLIQTPAEGAMTPLPQHPPWRVLHTKPHNNPCWLLNRIHSKNELSILIKAPADTAGKPVPAVSPRGTATATHPGATQPQPPSAGNAADSD